MLNKLNSCEKVIVKKQLLTLSIIILVGLVITGCSSRDNEITVGFLYTGNVEDYGISYAQDLAREKLVKEMNGALQTIVKESVDEAHVESVIYDMVNSGASLIFVSDNSLEGQIAKAAAVYTNVDFVVYNGTVTAENVKSYSAQNYEADYLAGYLAGKETETDVIGYIAPDDTPNTLVRIDAFALGVMQSNPDAIVDLDYVSIDNSQSRINAAVSKFMFDRCDILATCSNENRALIEASNRGVKVIGNTSSGLLDSKTLVSAITYNFEDFYMSEIESVLDGTFDSKPYQGTLANEFLNLDTYVGVSQLGKRETNTTKDKIIKGNLVVFTGPFSDIEDNEIVPEGESITAEDLANMNVLLSNIRVLS